MSRYFTSEVQTVAPVKSGKEEVFTISQQVVDKVKKKRSYIEAAKQSGSYAKKQKEWKKQPDPFPGPAPIDPEALEKHSRGDGVNPNRVRTKFGQKMAKRREETMQTVQETAARYFLSTLMTF